MRIQLFKHKLSFLLAPVVICWCLFCLQGCKEPLIEDDNLLTSDDNLNLAKDTLYAKVFSEFEEPLKSSGVSVGILGSLADPNFGKTYAGFYAQCQLTSNNIYFGENPVIDSAFLIIKYNGSYGRFDQPVDINLFELSQDMNDSSTYKTNTSFSVKVPAIGTLPGYTLASKMTDSVATAFGNLAPHIRIPLNSVFAQSILSADTNTVLRDNAGFLNFFKGFYLSTGSSSTGNGLLYLNLQTPVSGIALYYHNNTDDSLRYLIPISGVSVNHFDNIYSSTPVQTSVTTPNPAGEEKMYVQAGVGVKGKILIQGFDSLPKNIAVNKAELVLSEVATTAAPDTFASPLLLNLYRTDDAGQIQTIDDQGLNGFGGVRTAENVNGVTINRYRFNIKKYFQKLVQGTYNNNGFYVEAIAPASNSERVVIANSSSDKNYQITLVITYTKL